MMTFIYDRTRYDVKNAKRLKEDKFLKGIALTDEEKAIMSKGTLGFDEISRIAYNIRTVKREMEASGYYAQIGNNIIRQFSETSVFYKTDLETLIENIEALKKAFFPYPDTPSQPMLRLHYEEINKIEKILFDLDKRLTELRGYIKECGDFETGEEQ